MEGGDVVEHLLSIRQELSAHIAREDAWQDSFGRHVAVIEEQSKLLARLTSTVEEHVRRTNLLERRTAPVVRAYAVSSVLVRVAGWLAAAAGGALGLWAAVRAALH